MKITNEQAERLFPAAQKYWKLCVSDRPSPEALQNAQRELGHVILEIEAANQPPEIRWCVAHNRKAVGQHDLYTPYDGPLCFIESSRGCEIWTYVPKGRK